VFISHREFIMGAPYEFAAMPSITKTVFKVGDFVSWAKAGQLDLSPKFQRRPVWKPGAKSFLIDTIIRDLPIPIVFLRDRVSVGSIISRREVVDGQQRLRTILSFIDPTLVKNFEPERDKFSITKSHNKNLAGLSFSKLPAEIQQRIIGYEIPVHVFSSDTEDRDVLQIFARLNSTGMKLNGQELRNADYYGVFKTLCYSIGYQNLGRWEEWGVFGDAAISRMSEVEEVSDLIISMHEGVHGKTQTKIDDYYEDFDDEYAEAVVVEKRFDTVMNAIDHSIGNVLRGTEFSRQSLFHCLFLAVYELTYGLNSDLKAKRAEKLPENFSVVIQRLSSRLASDRISEDLRKSLRGATSDFGTRLQRLNFILEPFGRAFE
jgi:hypothetical protein